MTAARPPGDLGMVGRERQLAILVDLLTGTFSGRGRAAVLIGEAGIGKSTLAGALAGRAEAVGVPTLWCWCPAIVTLPYFPWRPLLLRLGLDEPGPDSRSDAGLDRRRLFASILDGLAELGRERPALVVVEDAHWADLPSLTLLRLVVEAVPSMPVCLVVTARDDPFDASPDAAATLRELPTAVAQHRVERTRPAPRSPKGNVMTSAVDTAANSVTSASTEAAPLPDPVEQLTGRLFGAAVGMADLFAIELGVRLGLYQALAERGPQDAATLTARTGLAERYVREWLQGQTTTGLASADGRDVATARFDLAPGVAEVLLDPLAPTHLAPLAATMAAIGEVLPRLVEAFRTGEGVPYGDYPLGYHIQSAFNRPAFSNDLVQIWLAAMPGVAARLADTTRPAHVCDLGCGAGWSAIALAKAYPHITVEGIDNDPPSVGLARAHATENGVADRVIFTVADLGDATAGAGARYDVAFFFECLHDSAPAGGGAAQRTAVAAGRRRADRQLHP